MKTILQSIEIPPTIPMNPLGEYTHLLRLSFQHEDEVGLGIMPRSIYCLYNRRDNTLSQIIEDSVAEFAVAVAFKNAETSGPATRV